VCVCVCVCGWVVFPFFFLGWECVQAPHLMAKEPSADEVLDRALTSDFGDFGFSREKQAARGVKVGGGGGGRHALVGGGGARFKIPPSPRPHHKELEREPLICRGLERLKVLPNRLVVGSCFGAVSVSACLGIGRRKCARFDPQMFVCIVLLCG
jgi:hypothetical protein